MPSSFHDIQFPTSLSRHAIGGPERKIEVMTLGSGHEQRNARWAHGRRRYKIGFGIKSLDDLDRVLHFFEERRGPLHAFRFKDPFDHKSCAPSQTPSHTDQVLAKADGHTQTFFLTKTYGTAILPFIRPITKPVMGSVLLGLNGHPVSQGDATVDVLTGAITFSVPPPAETLVTAGFFFDVPVRFETSVLESDLEAFQAGSIPDMTLIEVRE